MEVDHQPPAKFIKQEDESPSDDWGSSSDAGFIPRNRNHHHDDCKDQEHINSSVGMSEASSAFGSTAATKGEEVKPEPECFFFEIPPELRNEIYMLALCNPHTIQITPSGYERPGLVSTCKIIRTEALAVYYYNNKFRIHVRQYSPAPFLHLYKTFENTKIIPKKLQLTTELVDDKPNWTNLLAYLKYVHDGGRRMFAYSPEHIFKKSGNYPGILGVRGAGDKMVMSSMVVTCKHLRGTPWKGVLRILTEQRPMLISIDDKWGNDEVEAGAEQQSAEGEDDTQM